MSASDIRSESRRQFLTFLSGSPLLAYSGLGTGAPDGPTAPPRLSDPIIWAPLRTEDLIKSPAEAINVFDFEPVARKTVPPAHFGYMASGIDDEVTLRANREAFQKFVLRPRRLVDVSKVDMSTDLLGVRYATPISVMPGVDSLNTDADIITIARLTSPAKPSAITTSRFENRSRLRHSPSLQGRVLFWVKAECT